METLAILLEIWQHNNLALAFNNNSHNNYNREVHILYHKNQQRSQAFNKVVT